MSLSNPKSASSVPNAVAVVNGYLWDSLNKIDPGLNPKYKGITPIIPMHDSSAGKLPWGDNPYLIYNRIFRRAVTPFYPIKRDTFFYTLKADAGQTMEWTIAIQIILDRQDDAAKDVNEWNRMKHETVPGWDQPVFFHSFRLFQIERTDARSYSVDANQETQFMLDAQYHFTKEASDFNI